MSGRKRVMDEAAAVYAKRTDRLAMEFLGALSAALGVKMDEVNVAALRATHLLLVNFAYATAVQSLMDAVAMGLVQPSVFVHDEELDADFSVEAYNAWVKATRREAGQ